MSNLSNPNKFMEVLVSALDRISKSLEVFFAIFLELTLLNFGLMKEIETYFQYLFVITLLFGFFLLHPISR